MSDGESLRAGMFLEELDAFSADCSMRHADGYSPQRPLTVVTAAHDGLSIFAEGHRSPLSSRHDLRLRGCVVGVGTSSMEVQTCSADLQCRPAVQTCSADRPTARAG